MARFMALLFIFLSKLLIVSTNAAPSASNLLSHSPAEPRSGHETGGEEYLVILAKSAPSVSDILKRIELSPDHIDVRHLFDNSAFRGFAAHMKSHCINELRKMRDVLHVEKSRTATSHAVTVEQTVRLNSPWGLQRVSSSSATFGNPMLMAYTYTYASNSTLGRGVDIYVVDTGIYTANLVFGGHARMGYSFSPDIADNDGHGTHVSGTAAGYVFGVASGASLIGVKVLGSDGSGSTSDTVAGMDYVIKQHDLRKAQDPSFVGSIMSMSWGLSGISQVIQTAVSAALSNGIHVSMAAGNSAADACQYSPSAAGGSSSAAISVGSIAPDASISSFSNTGACVDLYAPGENVLSAWIGGDNYVKYLSGTSMACPHVTGVMAYLMAADQSGVLGASPAALKNKLLEMSLKGVVQGYTAEGDGKRLLNNGMSGRVAGSGVRLSGRGRAKNAFKRRDLEELISRLLWDGKMRLALDGQPAFRY